LGKEEFLAKTPHYLFPIFPPSWAKQVAQEGGGPQEGGKEGGPAGTPPPPLLSSLHLIPDHRAGMIGNSKD